jgi:hypothetical protein
VLRIGLINAAIHYSFANQGNCNSNGAPEERLAASDAINHESDEDQICGIVLVKAALLKSRIDLLARGPTQL